MELGTDAHTDVLNKGIAMLVITRGKNESIRIICNGQEVGQVKVCRVAGGRVRLGLDFPIEYKILRDEIEFVPEERTEE